MKATPRMGDFVSFSNFTAFFRKLVFPIVSCHHTTSDRNHNHSKMFSFPELISIEQELSWAAI